jgi:phosphonate transport system permease protein
VTATSELDLVGTAEFEQAEAVRLPQRRRRDSASSLWPRRLCLLALSTLGGWAFYQAVIAPRAVVNRGGWPLLRRFFVAAAAPRLDGEYLSIVGRAALTSLAYAVVGAVLSLCIGLVGGMVTSELWWRRDPLSGRGRVRTLGALRAAASVPRGVHEAIWALGLVFVLGRNPWVAVLAIAIPFGAISAKVVADIIDDSPSAGQVAFAELRMRGAGRLTALWYSVMPTVSGQMVSYGFYRLECALRSSVVLGAIGAGGLGFELSNSFQGLAYNEIWTLLYVLIAISAALDAWSASLRSRPTLRWRRGSLAVAAAATAGAAWWLELRPSTLFDARARSLAGRLGDEAWPPVLPSGGWGALGKAFADTVQLSVIAISVAVVIGVPLAVLAARPQRGGAARAASALTRLGLVTVRAIPPTVWAFLVLFVIFPGPLAGGVALGVYTAGVLGRLCAETIESADRTSSDDLRALGASRLTSFAYGVLPDVAPRFASLSMYRWEVAARETVIVGLVGAGGLGRLLAQQNTSFNEAAMVTTIGALIVLSWMIDRASRMARRVLR